MLQARLAEWAAWCHLTGLTGPEPPGCASAEHDYHHPQRAHWLTTDERADLAAHAQARAEINDERAGEVEDAVRLLGTPYTQIMRIEYVFAHRRAGESIEYFEDRKRRMSFLPAHRYAVCLDTALGKLRNSLALAPQRLESVPD